METDPSTPEVSCPCGINVEYCYLSMCEYYIKCDISLRPFKGQCQLQVIPGGSLALSKPIAEFSM